MAEKIENHLRRVALAGALGVTALGVGGCATQTAEATPQPTKAPAVSIQNQIINLQNEGQEIVNDVKQWSVPGGVALVGGLIFWVGLQTTRETKVKSNRRRS